MKKTWLISYSVISVLNLVLLPLNCFCYEKNDHEALCNFVVDKTIDGFSFDQYLKQNLGFDLGKDQYFTEAPIMVLFWFGIFAKEPVNAKKCIAQGARDEDSPEIRCKNHFHDPLLSWNQAGLHGDELVVLGESSLLWAQRAQDDQYFGAYSWHDARDYFYKALTSTDPGERAMNLMLTFQAVGHLMHLVQDATVPEHVRDNYHIPFEYNYEKYVSNYDNQTGLINITLFHELANQIIQDTPSTTLPLACRATAKPRSPLRGSWIRTDIAAQTLPSPWSSPSASRNIRMQTISARTRSSNQINIHFPTGEVLIPARQSSRTRGIHPEKYTGNIFLKCRTEMQVIASARHPCSPVRSLTRPSIWPPFWMTPYMETMPRGLFRGPCLIRPGCSNIFSGVPLRSRCQRAGCMHSLRLNLQTRGQRDSTRCP